MNNGEEYDLGRNYAARFAADRWLSSHITSAFGATNRPPGSTNPHRAVDFNYDVGPSGQQGINLTHPTVHSPVAGVVTHTGSEYGIIAIRDINGLSHQILHTQTQKVKKGDLVGVGTPIGTMGNTGADAQHGAAPPDMPAQPFFNPFGNTRPSGPNSFADRFGNWGSAPLPDGSAASDDPANFSDRFGTWDRRTPGALGNIGAPALEVTPDQGKRSEADDGPVHVLSRRADLSSLLPAGDAPPFSAASPPPPLGIFSGKPMPDWPVQPSTFQLKDQSSPDDNELFQRWMRWVDG